MHRISGPARLSGRIVRNYPVPVSAVINMSVHVTSNSAFSSAASVHLLPCTILSNGPAKVDVFFTSNTQEDEVGLVSAFRGRELRGQTVFIPDGYKGIVLQELNRPFTEDQDRNVRISAKFNEFTYWNLQTPPSSQDKVTSALQWANLSSVIHAPVSDDDQDNSPTSIEFSR
ncbi:putative ribonuclease H2 subunit C-like isoform X2 [Apostichopus japonicus]|uniref:Putative ribonuclease H2 subunit C-like isoform X2 n=1 Tax=Stichopus japonicus TaxID=307972 RepID=A0A2G8LMN0_STIJA|nr:putative ribonuclease H2 subunit C-like isoform X2 [Apostichopus japonicus]